MLFKKDRQRVLVEIWVISILVDIDFFDKGDEIVVIIVKRDNVVGWWLDIFIVFYLNQIYREKNELVKIKSVFGVIIKLFRKIGLMKISGKNYWGWMVVNFTDVLETVNNESEELDDVVSLMFDNFVTRYLQFDKNVEMVGIGLYYFVVLQLVYVFQFLCYVQMDLLESFDYQNIYLFGLVFVLLLLLSIDFYRILKSQYLGYVNL